MTKIKNYIRGDTRQITVNIVDSSGLPVITGGTLFFTVNASDSPADDSAAIISKTVNIPVGNSSGTIILTNTDTQNITPGVYYYDAQFKDASGNVYSLLKDQFLVVADITRRIV